MALVIIAGLALAYGRPQSVLALRGWIEAAGAWAPLLYVLLQASRGVTWVPGSLLTPLGGLCFGLWGGLLYSWIGVLAAMALGFGIVRVLGPRSHGEGARRLFGRVLARAGGRLWLAVLLARLVPGIPFNVVSYLAGATPLRWPPYLAASAVGILPRMAAQVAIGAGLYSVAS